MNLFVTVPSFRKITENEKSFTVFCIEVHHGSHVYTVERRYTDFEELHKKMKRSQHTPAFPPKTMMKWNHKVLESRRIGFEQYIQSLLVESKLPRSFIKFLELKIRSESMESLDRLSDAGATHQPMLAFSENYLMSQQKGSLPDILVAGAMQGLYESLDDLR